ncbi:MAG: AMP-binding protein [Ignavibacteriaceae bacterium]|nr:AMP-binding protein [Ignavibacteriaceae bacterium]
MLLNKISQSFQKYSDQNAFCIDNTYYTYKQLALAVSKIRRQIEKDCSGNQKLYGLIAFESHDFYTYASIYGSLFAGVGYVPINPKNPLDRNNSVIQQAELTTILTSKLDDRVKELAEANHLHVIVTSELPEVKIDYSLPNVSGEEIAYILFTSGSTGVPKGVPIQRKNVDAFIDAFFALGYKIDENDKFLQMFDLTFDFSVICYFAPLVTGSCIYPIPSEGIKYANVYITLEEHQITFACMVPSMITYLRPYFPEINLPELKYTLFCGEALYDDIAHEWLKCIPNGKIINAYGPTEATVFCLIYDFDPENGKSKTFNGAIAIGKEMENMKAIVINENKKLLPINEKGELCLSGPQVTPGYWKNEEKNNESFFTLSTNGEEEIFYRTGDLGLIDEEGDFLYCGRIDFQVKIQGFRVELGEIEHHVRNFTNLVNVAALPVQNNSGTTQLHLFLENYLGDLKELENYLASKIPTYMVPTSMSSLPLFPLNMNGKVDRKKLNELLT